jgi:hypothetical protein
MYECNDEDVQEETCDRCGITDDTVRTIPACDLSDPTLCPDCLYALTDHSSPSPTYTDAELAAISESLS